MNTYNDNNLRDNEGKIIGIMGFATDNTKQKYTEDKLFEEHNSLRTLIDALPDNIYAKDTEGRFTLANKALAKNIGAESTEAMIGKTDFDFYPKDVASSFFSDEQEVMRSGKPLLQKDEIHPSLHGCTIRVLTSKTPLLDINGNITGIVGIGHDITSVSKMEWSLVEVNTRLQTTLNELRNSQDQIIKGERLRALGQMASGITHDFNNALTPVLAYSDLLLNEPGILNDRETTIGMLNDIRTAAVDAAQTVRRLNEYYAPAVETDWKTIEVNNLITSAVNLTSPRWKQEMAEKGISITVVTKLGEVGNVLGNESQLREMLTNLIFNAVDAMPKGGTLTIKSYMKATSVSLEVSDTGTGMTEEVRSRCFEPFFTTKHRRGSGLGLAMVHGIVRQHNSKIELHSIENKGTRVIIRIPQTLAPVESHPLNAAGLEGSRQLHILLVEDERIIRQTIEVCLTTDNHTVRTAVNGKEGLEIFSRDHFDIVITDRAMPDISGDTVAAEIKKRNPNMPVIMLTGFGHIMQETIHYPPGVDLIVSKPITRDALNIALTKAFSIRMCGVTADRATHRTQQPSAPPQAL